MDGKFEGKIIYNFRPNKEHLQRRRKHQKMGGGHTFSRNVGNGGGGGVSRYTTPKCTFLTTFYFKTSKFQNKKGTFDVNLVFTATLAFTKRALFITKKQFELSRLKIENLNEGQRNGGER